MKSPRRASTSAFAGSERSGIWAVVPVRVTGDTKRRLAPVLSPDEREALACAMLSDVLSALARTRALAGVLVVTSAPAAAGIARACGACVLDDAQNGGMAAAVACAAGQLAGLDREGMLVVPADVPTVTPEDVAAIVAAHRTSPAVTLVRAAADGGTNALACTPPGAIAFRFGDDSFRRHCDEARACGIEPQILELAGVSLDIDRPRDLTAFLARPSATQTYAYLEASGIARRLRGAGPAQDPVRVSRAAQTATGSQSVSAGGRCGRPA